MPEPDFRAALQQLADAVDGWEMEPAEDDPLAIATAPDLRLAGINQPVCASAARGEPMTEVLSPEIGSTYSRVMLHLLGAGVDVTTHTLYAGPAGTGRLVITARPTATGTPQAQWLVQFTRWGRSGKMLDQCAAWMPTLKAWDQGRWHPIGSRLIPIDVLATVEVWLQGRPVGKFETTTAS